MRLRRSFLLLAAGLSVSAALSAAPVIVNVNADLPIFDRDQLKAADEYIIGSATLTINLQRIDGSPIDDTFVGRFKDSGAGNGTILKTGGGTLQYDGFYSGSPENTYLKNHTFTSLGTFTAPADLRTDAFNPNNYATAGNAFAGTLRIQQGQLQVSGAINQWADYGILNGNFGINGNGVMFGASQVIIEGGAKLSFQNTRRNLVGADANLGIGSKPDTPDTPLVGRINYVHNLQAAVTSEVEVGRSSVGDATPYILVAHSDFGAAGLPAGESSLGVLTGNGRFYKTGVSDMVIRGSATFDGEVVLGGGRVTLAAVNGDTLWAAKSVNLAPLTLAFRGDNQGTNTPGVVSPDTGYWKPAYAPDSDSETIGLAVTGDQRIRNFQSLFGENKSLAITQRADNLTWQPLLPATGAGSVVEITGVNDILRITQEAGYDGYYTGAFIGDGTLQKNGAGTLAIICLVNNISTIDVQEGKIISNVESLGSGTVNIGANGELSIVQNTAGALRALITSTSTLGELRFKSTDAIRYRTASADTIIGNTDAGVADITIAQPNFRGKVIVEDGNAIVFSAGVNDAFSAASGIQLLNGSSGRETSIRFNDTNQLVNNLSGDAYSRIFLGRGNITLNTTLPSSYSGGIEGVGNLIKTGTPTFTLDGSTTYFGATVVKQGTLAVKLANGIGNTSGAVLLAGATLSGTGDQALGSLFGQAGSTYSTSGNLTVGVSDAFRLRLDTELRNLPDGLESPTAAYYLATETTGSVNDFSPGTTEFFVLQQYQFTGRYNTALAAILAANPGISQVDAVAQATAQANAEILAQLDTITVDGIVDQDEADLHREYLAFAGTLNLGSGSLTKVGVERLILSGTANYSGATNVLGGTLEIGTATLNGTSAINLGSDGTLAINQADTVSSKTLGIAITGDGVFQKLGLGRLDVDANGTNFTGTYDVVEGTLAVSFRQGTRVGYTDQGNVGVSLGATFVAKVATNLIWLDGYTNGGVYGAGDFTKTGAGILDARGYVYQTGLTSVEQGGLISLAMPAGDLAIAQGAGFTANVADNPDTDVDDYFAQSISGAGTLTKAGLGDLRIENAQPLFTGDLVVSAGSLTLVAANAFGSAANVSLADNTTLVLLGGLSQSLNNVQTTGTGAVIEVATAGTVLTLNVASGTRDFSAQIVGSPVVTKTGAGTLTFLRPDTAANDIQTINILGGEIVATHGGLGGADIFVDAGAKLRFTSGAGETDVFAMTITGSGAIAKSGAGTVDLSAATYNSISTTLAVDGGTLIVSESGLGAGRAPVVTLATGTTFEYRATNNASFGVGNFSGDGNVTFGRTGTDTPTITLTPNGAGTTGYTGLTTVRTGVTLALGNGFSSLGGIATETGSFLDLSAIPSLTITQPVDATFAGALVGTANLTFKGGYTLTYTANGGSLTGYIGSVTVDGGALALDLSNTKAIALANGGTLSLRGLANNYTGAITGSGKVVLEDGVDIDLTVGGNAATTSLGSAAVTRITLEGGAHLTAAFTTGAVLAGKSIQLDGGLLTATGTGAISLALAAPNATPGAANGDSGLELTGTAAYTVTGRVIGDLTVGTDASATFLGAAKTGATPPADITGGITVDGSLRLGAAGSAVTVAGSATVFAGATLSGAWTLSGALGNGGTLAPGFSPAHVSVGSLDNSGTLQMELSADSEDQIAFTGSAVLNRDGTGVLELVRYGAGHSYGVRHVILKDTDTTVAGSYLSAAAEDPRFASVVSAGTSTTSLRYLLVYPTQLQGGADGILGNADDAADPLRSLAVDGEIAVYEVRSRAEYVCPDATANVLAWVRDITEVNSTETAPGSGIWVSTPAAGFTALGARFATLTDDRLCVALDNLAPLGQFSLATVALAGTRADQTAVARRLELRRFDMAGTSVKTSEWFVDAIGGRTTVDAGPTASIAGATAGFIRDIGFDGYLGLSFGVDKSKGTNGAASVNTSGIRLGAFGGLMTDDRSVAVDVGLSYSALSGDITHPSAFDANNAAAADASTLAGWVRLSSAVALDETWSLTPFAQFEASSTRLTGLSESGQVDALTVNDAKLSESSLSAGLGIQSSWTDGRGGWRYRLSLDIAYASQLSGDTLSLTSGVPGEGLALYTSDRQVLPGSGFVLAPSFTFGPDPDSTYTVGIRFDQASQGNATSWEIGYRKRF